MAGREKEPEGGKDPPPDLGGGSVSAGSSPPHPPRRRTPLKTLLQNFLNHVETLEAQKNEGENTYEKEFMQLKSQSDALRSQPDFSCSEGEMEVNRKKNRYKDILPFDASRVRLTSYPGVPGSDYINANFIKGASGSNAYIASQGPLPHTVNDFWRMVVESEVQVIVMACNETEAGKHKCERYWREPEKQEPGSEEAAKAADDKESEPDDEAQFGKFSVKLLKMREICPDFSVRTMRLRWTSDDGVSEERTVCQFHYSAWPDHGIPTQVKPLLDMVRLIRDCQASETLPVLIHCSAGCGRTGTICAIDFIWGLLRTGKLSSDFSLFELVRDMRRQRIAMVQTVDQYILVHRAVRELFLEQLRVIDSHPYENVDDDGNPLGKNPDEITPEYETIFVKSEGGGQDIEKILSQRISAHQQAQSQTPPRTLMGTAMLPKDSRSPSRRIDIPGCGDGPPKPPPKQRHLDSAAIDSRKVDSTPVLSSSAPLAPIEDFLRPAEPKNLFEPPQSSGQEPGSGKERYKKGQLRLTQTENGGWKLEELEDEKLNALDNNNKSASAEKVNKSSQKPAAPLVPNSSLTSSSSMQNVSGSSSSSSGGSGGGKRGRSKKKDGEEGGSGKSELLRRPSMKKIRAFFNKDKDSSSSSSSSSSKQTEAAAAKAKNGSGESPTASDPDMASALSKVPKFEIRGGGDSSDSTPSSSRSSTSPSPPGSKSVPSSLDRKQHRSRTPRADTHDYANLTPDAAGGGLHSSHSHERLVLANADQNRPLLPIKRSKSMKAMTKPEVGLPWGGDEADRARQPMQQQQRRSANEGSSSSKPPIPTPMQEYQSLPASSAGVSLSTPPSAKEPSPQMQSQRTPPAAYLATAPAKPRRLNPAGNEYANVRMSRDREEERARDKYLEAQLAKLHEHVSSARQSNSSSAAAIPAELKRSLPLIARSSDSLDADSKRMLKECQDYLMASFDAAEREGDRLFQRPPGVKNRSAESSPMTTLQKEASSSLFSSHSSPSSSYNKYKAKPGSGVGHAPPPSMAVNSPTGAIVKSYYGPEGLVKRPNLRPGSQISPKHSPSQETSSPGDRDYANLPLQQQQEQETAIYSNGPRSRERRNSFREAVEKTGGAAEGADRKKGYDLWMGADENTEPSPRKSPRSERADPQYANSILIKQQQQHSPVAGPQQPRRRSTDNGTNPHQILRAPPPGQGSPRSFHDLGGYEPVQFKTSREEQQRHSLSPSASSSKLQASRSSQLQSVGLVAEVLNGSKPVVKPPPPYKEPPQPTRMYKAKSASTSSATHAQNRVSLIQPPAQFSAGSVQQQHLPPELPAKESATYANLHMPKRQSREAVRHSPRQQQQHVSQDDLSLQQQHGGRQGRQLQQNSNNAVTRRNKRSSSQVVMNRLSLGDFSAMQQQQQQRGYGAPLQQQQPRQMPHSSSFSHSPQSLPSTHFAQHHGLTVKPPTADAPVGSPPGIDLDAVAAMMSSYNRDDDSRAAASMGASPHHHGQQQQQQQHHNSGNANKALSRTLAGLMSGAAANLRSKFNNLGGSVGDLHFHNLQGGGSSGGAEQSAASIPLTVPGAASSTVNPHAPHRVPHALSQQSSSSSGDSGGSTGQQLGGGGGGGPSKYQYGYPHRVDSRPIGPRDPPAHFQRKQEYL